METDTKETEQPAVASTGLLCVKAVELRKSIDSMNRHIAQIDIARDGYSATVKESAYAERTKLVDALVALTHNSGSEAPR